MELPFWPVGPFPQGLPVYASTFLCHCFSRSFLAYSPTFLCGPSPAVSTFFGLTNSPWVSEEKTKRGTLPISGVTWLNLSNKHIMSRDNSWRPHVYSCARRDAVCFGGVRLHINLLFTGKRYLQVSKGKCTNNFYRVFLSKRGCNVKFSGRT